MLIETNDIGLMLNSLVDIIIDVPVEFCLYKKKIPAVVTRCEPGNIAISFEKLEKGTETLLTETCDNSLYTASNI